MKADNMFLQKNTCLLGKVFQGFEEQQWLLYTSLANKYMLKVCNGNLRNNREDNLNENIFKDIQKPTTGSVL